MMLYTIFVCICIYFLAGYMDRAKRTVRRNIGLLWPNLAQELGFSHSDIHNIKENERNNVHGQIFEMFRQWECRSDTGKRSVYELLVGLRKAVSSIEDVQLRNIRDRVFTDAVLGQSCIHYTY